MGACLRKPFSGLQGDRKKNVSKKSFPCYKM